jgi:hypothetical protein
VSSKVLSRLDDLLFGPEAPARLLAVQGLVLILISLRTILSPYPKLAGAPAGLFKPAWITSFLDQMPPRSVIVVVQLVVVAAAATWFLVGRNPQESDGGARPSRWRGPIRRAMFAIAWLGFLFLAALRGSRGKIFHIELVLVWAALPLVFAPGDARWSDRAPKRRYGWPIRSAIGVMSAIYCMTGIWKLRNSGIRWVFSDNMKFSLLWGRVRGARPPLGDVGVWLADHHPLPRVFAACILLFEVTFPLVIVFRRVRPLYVAAAWTFHLGTLLLLGLDYVVWPCTVTILLLNWPAVADRLGIARPLLAPCAPVLPAHTAHEPVTAPSTA